jgi:uncharacterized protein (UPF0333 family)
MKRRNGQSMAEFTIVLTVVVMAIVAMQLYVKRGLQGKVRDVSDHVTTSLVGVTATQTDQYEPYYAQSNYTVAQNQNVNEQYLIGGQVDRNAIAQQTSRTGNALTGSAADLAQDDAWQ